MEKRDSTWPFQISIQRGKDLKKLQSQTLVVKNLSVIQGKFQLAGKYLRPTPLHEPLTNSSLLKNSSCSHDEIQGRTSRKSLRNFSIKKKCEERGKMYVSEESTREKKVL